MLNSRRRQILVRSTIAVSIAAAFSSQALACRMYVGTTLEDVSYADQVVIGRIANYRIIRDQAFRDRMIASPHLSDDSEDIYRDPEGSLLPDYARFEIEVEKVLVGDPRRTLSVTWDNSTFGEHKTMAPGPYLIALRNPASASPPLRGPSATIRSAPDPDAFTVLQAPCSSPFIYEARSEQANAILEMLSQDN